MPAKNTENKNFSTANKGNKKCRLQLRKFKKHKCRYTMYAYMINPEQNSTILKQNLIPASRSSYTHNPVFTRFCVQIYILCR